MRAILQLDFGSEVDGARNFTGEGAGEDASRAAAKSIKLTKSPRRDLPSEAK